MKPKSNLFGMVQFGDTGAIYKWQNDKLQAREYSRFGGHGVFR